MKRLHTVEILWCELSSGHLSRIGLNLAQLPRNQGSEGPLFPYFTHFLAIVATVLELRRS
jgi:hypothetical protein